MGAVSFLFLAFLGGYGIAGNIKVIKEESKRFSFSIVKPSLSLTCKNFKVLLFKTKRVLLVISTKNDNSSQVLILILLEKLYIDFTSSKETYLLILSLKN